MLALLPLVVFAAVWISLAARDPAAGLARALLRASLVVGAWTVVTTEALSLGSAITRSGLALAWGVPGVLLWGWILRSRGPRALDPLTKWRARDRPEALALSAIAVAMLATALVAWAAPPQTWDSLNYHMSRVAHWAQNASVEPFATGIETQNSRSPGAEFGVLHLYVLAGSDRWVNFVAWAAVVGIVAAAWSLARQVGAGREGQLLTAAFVASMPMAIIQASSTMTDVVAALWVAAGAVEVLAVFGSRSPWGSAFWAGLAAGLAILTKPTTVPFLAPLGVWGVFLFWHRHGWRAAATGGLASAALVLMLNGGHWMRSYQLYGDPISGGDQLDVHANQALGLDGQISNVLRNAALEVGTPSPHINRAIALAIVQVHRWLGISPNDPRTTSHGYFKVEVPTTRENTAGNPLQAYLALFGLGSAFLRRDSPKTLRWLSLVAVVGFWLFATLFKWQIFGSRYHVVFFVLAAPAAGVALARWAGARRSTGIAWAMLALGLPWLLSVRSRPLLPIPGNSLVGSVLVEPRSTLLLANAKYLATPYGEMADLILDTTCSEIGIALGGNSAEYPLWWFLGFPQTRRTIEWMVEGSPSSARLPADFRPCAVICEGCERDALFRGLPRVYARSGFVLFLEPQAPVAAVGP